MAKPNTIIRSVSKNTKLVFPIAFIGSYVGGLALNTP